MSFVGDFPQAWKTGIDEIDEDHLHLFEMINTFLTTKEPSEYVEREFLDMFLAELMNHFEKEEHLMVLHNYPDTEAHKNHHRQVFQHLVGLRNSDMNTIDVAKECQKAFIRDMLANDMALKQFMAGKSIRNR